VCIAAPGSLTGLGDVRSDLHRRGKAAGPVDEHLDAICFDVTTCAHVFGT